MLDLFVYIQKRGILRFCFFVTFRGLVSFGGEDLVVVADLRVPVWRGA